MTDNRHPALARENRLEALLEQMTLAEKIGQITQAEKNSLTPDEVRTLHLGSVLSGGGGYPTPNTPEAWLEMVNGFRQAALETRLGIPLLYGVDAVHGHNNVRGATIFPHNIGLGAANDPGLVERIARATAAELAATGVQWNFAPTVAVPQDIRWGRTYEGYGETAERVAALGAAYVRGLQEAQPPVAATAKHFIGDGATAYGTSNFANEGYAYLLDQGDARLDEATLRARFLPPYLAALRAGVLTVMASFNSWNGLKLHAHRYLLTEVLKGELGFAGLIVSDWQAVDQVAADYDDAVQAALNAGIDMVMVPFDYRRFIDAATRAVEAGAVPLSRLDDAVRRVLRVKLRLGLFEGPAPAGTPLEAVGCAAHRALAREAVRRSVVLLKNEAGTLPIRRDTTALFVGGPAADDIGAQCGGWTIEWLGKRGAITPGTTILDGLREAAGPGLRVEYAAEGQFAGRAEVGVAVVAEEPYAEGMGDRASLALGEADTALIERMRASCERLVLVILSGRPLIVTDLLPRVDALVAAWLPGTEGAGVADLLLGEAAFTGRLPYTWPRTMDQVPLSALDGAAPLFARDFGLTDRG
jgi:beta-glucosidase